MNPSTSINEFKKMAEKEMDYAKALSSLGDRIKHPVLRAILTGISNDSIKHSLLYKAIVDLLSIPQPVISEEEFKEIVKEIESHIETEAKMIEFVKNMLKNIDDARLKLLLSAIYDDEVEHHKLLVDLRDNFAKLEIITEKDIWEAIWRDSPWHGTPGG